VTADRVDRSCRVRAAQPFPRGHQRLDHVDRPFEQIHCRWQAVVARAFKTDPASAGLMTRPAWSIIDTASVCLWVYAQPNAKHRSPPTHAAVNGAPYDT
jgi:hypothetical protein